MSGSWGGGKGSKPRPLTSTQEEYAEKWNAIFSKKEKKEINDYQDLLSTEDCFLDGFPDEDD